jgi:hypothetical protein
MTSREMQISFVRELTAISEHFESPDMIGSDTIMYWINNGQDEYLKKSYISKASTKENVEFIQKRLEDLKQLVSRKTMFAGTSFVISNTEPTSAITISATQSTRIGANADGSLAFPLPSDYFYYVRSTSKVSGTYIQSATKSYINNNLIEHSDINPAILVNAINTPIIRNPLVILESSPVTGDASKSYMLLYKDSYTNLFNIELVYIRYPKRIVLTITDSTTQTLTCELPFQTHQEIIDYSVKMYIEDYKFKLSSSKGTKGGEESK